LTPGSDHIVFVDESGDHGLESIEPSYPVFVLAFCIFEKSHYAQVVLPALTEFKFRHFGHDQIVLHERDIRKDLGPFALLRDPTAKGHFLDELTDLVAAIEMTVIASVIRKDRLVASYNFPEHPYEMALGFGLERTHLWLASRGDVDAPTTVVLERRGKREDDALELEFRRVCAGVNIRRVAMPLDPMFVPKSANVPGLQLADLVARPIGRHVLDPAQPNRAYDVIERKLRRSPSGKVNGWGLKVFPR
jgi:hypothetical protein